MVLLGAGGPARVGHLRRSRAGAAFRTALLRPAAGEKCLQPAARSPLGLLPDKRLWLWVCARAIGPGAASPPARELRTGISAPAATDWPQKLRLRVLVGRRRGHPADPALLQPAPEGLRPTATPDQLRRVPRQRSATLRPAPRTLNFWKSRSVGARRAAAEPVGDFSATVRPALPTTAPGRLWPPHCWGKGAGPAAAAAPSVPPPRRPAPPPGRRRTAPLAPE